MADLTHRADCHANGVAARYAMVAIGDLEPIGLCYHCYTVLAPVLNALKGAVVEVIATREQVAAK